MLPRFPCPPLLWSGVPNAELSCNVVSAECVSETEQVSERTTLKDCVSTSNRPLLGTMLKIWQINFASYHFLFMLSSLFTISERCIRVGNGEHCWILTVYILFVVYLQSAEGWAIDRALGWGLFTNDVSREGGGGWPISDQRNGG